GAHPFPFVSTCSSHEDLNSRVNVVETCVSGLKKTTGEHGALITAHNEDVIRELSQGTQDMKEMREDISEIKIKIGILLERSKQIRSTDGGG
ncbi:MAG: hypothetical protein KAS04_02265, partial [Candidatus Aenigmarchaeota archaeon]|nr:hypothetical protein [Candidatus Aenigmarchaeota archaeon]